MCLSSPAARTRVRARPPPTPMRWPGRARLRGRLIGRNAPRRNCPELFDYTQILAGQPLPDGDEIAIVTNAGGPGVMTTDAVGDSDLQLAQFGDKTFFHSARDALMSPHLQPGRLIGVLPPSASRQPSKQSLRTTTFDGRRRRLSDRSASFEELSERIVEQRTVRIPVAATMMGGKSVTRYELHLRRGRTELLRPRPARSAVSARSSATEKSKRRSTRNRRRSTWTANGPARYSNPAPGAGRPARRGSDGTA